MAHASAPATSKEEEEGEAAAAVALGLTDIPDELLLRVLGTLGCRALAVAACTCRLARRGQHRLAGSPAFASAMETDRPLTEALMAACRKAALSMPAAVSFAVIFTTGYSTTACRSTTLQQHLTGLLPPGVAVVGCSGYGLVGSGSNGQPVELDPQEEGRGVSVLLGHLPGVAAHAIAADKIPKKFHTEEDVLAWMGLPREAAARAMLMTVFYKSASNLTPLHINTLLDATRPLLPIASTVGGGCASPGMLYSLPSLQPDADAAIDMMGCSVLVLHGVGAASPSDGDSPPEPSPAAVRSLGLSGMGPVPGAGAHCISAAFAPPGAGGPITVSGPGAARLAADILRLCGDTLYEWPTVALWADGAPHRLCMADVEFYEEGMDVAEQEGLLLHLAARDEADLRQRLAGLAEADNAWELNCQLMERSGLASKEALCTHLPALFPEQAGPSPAAVPPCMELRQPGVAASTDSAFLMISCVARGAALYGAAGEEVRSLVECHRGSNGDRAPASLPIAGLFCGGEIGPCAAGGAAGLQIGGVGERQDDSAPIGEEAFSSALQDSDLQSYTSIISRLQSNRT